MCQFLSRELFNGMLKRRGVRCYVQRFGMCREKDWHVK